MAKATQKETQGKMKSPRKLERHFKGVANHRRIQILLLVFKCPDISLVGIAERVNSNMKTIAEHTRRLVIAGLVEKSHTGTSVAHKLTPYGQEFVQFIETFSRHGAN